MARILIVDDEKSQNVTMRLLLEGEGYQVVDAPGGAEALAALARESFDLVLTDLRMSPVDGLAVIEGARRESPGTPVIMLTAYADLDTAVEAMRRGAVNYLRKPWKMEEVKLAVARALDGAAVAREGRAWRREAQRAAGAAGLLGRSPAMTRLRDLVDRIAPSEATVLIRGESGSGKEVAARAIHEASARAAGPFVAVNCAAIPENLLESELFGYRRGAFTGADEDREGLFEAARGGTLLLDEIGEAGPGVQAKLLRVLAERRINRVGDPREREVDVRVLAATNRPLEDAIRAGRFREDLYYRLLVIPVDVPPLRERPGDVEILADHFLAGFGRREGLTADLKRRLRAYAWPGNVRELRNVIERAHILAGAQTIGEEHIMLDVATAPRRRDEIADAVGGLALEDNERRLIRAALQRAGGNKTEAAKMLGITRRTLYSRLNLLGLDGDGEAPRP